MESIKNAVGLGTEKQQQQGREPMNGETGAGTAGEPYDQGNSGGKSLTLPPVQMEADNVPQILAKVAKLLSSPMVVPTDRMGWEAAHGRAVSL
jgi:hypothetical protein